MTMEFKIINESGSIIIISLLILALLSLLGLASTTKSQTDINIAGNSKEIKNSLYSAEVSLVFAETSIPNMHKFKKLDEENVIGHHGIGDGDKEDYVMQDNNVIKNSYKETKNIWNSDQSSSSINKKITSDLRYAIKQFNFIPDCDTLGTNGCSNTGIDIYKVVGIGSGSSDKTLTMLETTFHWRHR